MRNLVLDCSAVLAEHEKCREEAVAPPSAEKVLEAVKAPHTASRKQVLSRLLQQLLSVEPPRLSSGEAWNQWRWLCDILRHEIDPEAAKRLQLQDQFGLGCGGSYRLTENPLASRLGTSVKVGDLSTVPRQNPLTITQCSADPLLINEEWVLARSIRYPDIFNEFNGADGAVRGVKRSADVSKKHMALAKKARRMKAQVQRDLGFKSKFSSNRKTQKDPLLSSEAAWESVKGPALAALTAQRGEALLDAAVSEEAEALPESVLARVVALGDRCVEVAGGVVPEEQAQVGQPAREGAEVTVWMPDVEMESAPVLMRAAPVVDPELKELTSSLLQQSEED